MNNLEKPILVRCLLRDQHGHVRPVEEWLGDQAVFIYDEASVPEKINIENTDIIICVNEHSYEIAQCIESARSLGIPSLLLQDGILEWRCQYTNLNFAAGGGVAQHQPVFSDKIACIGNGGLDIFLLGVMEKK